MRTRVYLDLDDVTADLARGWCKLYNQIGPFDVLRKWNGEIPVEEFFAHWGVGERFPGAIELLDTQGLFRNLALLPGAKEGVAALQQEFGFENVFFLSSATPVHAPSEKYAWVEEHFGWKMKHQTILSHRKDVIGDVDDLLVDDKPENVEGFKGAAIIVDQPHNRSWGSPGIMRAYDWDDIVRMVRFEMGEIEGRMRERNRLQIALINEAPRSAR